MAWRRDAMNMPPTSGRRAPLGADELAIGLNVLADLLEAGFPLTRTLQVFAQVAPRGWAPAVPMMIASVREGRGLARALGEIDLGVPPIVIGIVQAGESGSGIVAAVRRAALHTEEAAAIQATIRSALAYPALIAVVGGAALLFLIGVVMPRFGAVLADLGQALPPSTRAVLSIADFIRAWGLAIGASLVALGVAVSAWMRQPTGRRFADRAMLGLPVIGGIRWANATARFASSLSAMLESGMALRSGLRNASAAIGDSEIAARLESARARLDAGEPVGRALHAEAVLTPMALQLVSAGAEAGRLPSMLAFAARLERQRAVRLTQALVRFIEPSLILLFAGLVALVATAMLQAVYAVRPS